jgi:hypothetical protein
LVVSLGVGVLPYQLEKRCERKISRYSKFKQNLSLFENITNEETELIGTEEIELYLIGT